MSDLNEIELGQLCQSAIQSFYSVTGGLSNFPGLLRKVIVNRAWERRVNKGNVIELKNLRELITEKPIRGWGEDPKKVEAVIKDDPELLAMFREAMKEQGKRTDLLPSDSETSYSKGETKAYQCERLSKVAPELFEEVKAGRMSANAAAIQAGIRKKPKPEEVCVKAFRKTDNRLEAIKMIVSELKEHERQMLIEILQGATP